MKMILREMYRDFQELKASQVDYSVVRSVLPVGTVSFWTLVPEKTPSREVSGRC